MEVSKARLAAALSTVDLSLSADDLAEILEALHELRDPFGGRPTPLEERLLTAQRELEGQ